MAKRLSFRLTDEEVSVLEEAINHAPEAEVRQRASALRMLHLGQTPVAVGQAAMVTSNTI